MRLKCGLEVHAQLLAPNKLFSGTPVAFHAPPNTLVSFFDAALPGTQPFLNKTCVKVALRAALALKTDIQQAMAFDRKHYMYPDQPAGYQVTQNFKPFAKGGVLKLLARDLTRSTAHNQDHHDIVVRIKQLQIEQDTGKTIYSGSDAHIDLNRSNTALMELVTEPDLPTAEAAGAFVRKLQGLFRHIGVCTGDMETGAMRVDANVSVDGGPRCEIKNLFSPSAVVAAVKAEFKRQAELLAQGKTYESETRGWNGSTTYRLRVKDVTVDYRYMPDPELPEILIPRELLSELAASLPQSPDAIVDSLLDEGSISLSDARTLFDNGVPMVEYYKQALSAFKEKGGVRSNLVSSWLVHKWLSESKLLLPIQTLVEILLAIDNQTLTTTSAKLVFSHYAELLRENAAADLPSLESLIIEFDLNPKSRHNDLDEICQAVLKENEHVVARIKSGKKNAMAVLLGLVMRATQGTAKPENIQACLSRHLK